MQSNTIVIRGKEYKVPHLHGINMKMIPLYSVLGIDANGKDFFVNQTPERLAEFERTVIYRLSEPSNHYKIAYTISAIVPDIDPELCQYRLKLNPDGSQEIVATLDLMPDELLSIFAQIQAAQGPKEEKGDRDSELRELVASGNGFQKPRRRRR